jgi:hypothetical protein
MRVKNFIVVLALMLLSSSALAFHINTDHSNDVVEGVLGNSRDQKKFRQSTNDDLNYNFFGHPSDLLGEFLWFRDGNIKLVEQAIWLQSPEKAAGVLQLIKDELLPLVKWPIAPGLRKRLLDVSSVMFDETLSQYCAPVSFRSYGAMINWTVVRKQESDFSSASKSLNLEVLTGTEFRDLIVIGDPRKDEVQARVLASFIHDYGVIEGWRLIESLFLNAHQITSDLEKSLKMLVDNEVAVFFVPHDIAIKKMEELKRSDLEFLPITQRSQFKSDCLIMGQKARNRSIRTFVDFIYSGRIQARFMAASKSAYGPKITSIGRKALSGSAYKLKRLDIINNGTEHIASIDRKILARQRKKVQRKLSRQLISDIVGTVFVDQLDQWKLLGAKTKTWQPAVLRKTEMFSRALLPRETELLSFDTVWDKEFHRNRMISRLRDNITALFKKQQGE